MLMLLQFKMLLKSVILPPAGPLLLAILGAFLVRRRPLLARSCLILGLGSLWLLSTPVVSDTLLDLTEHYPPLDLRSAGGAQAIVILGGGEQRAFAPEYGGPAAAAGIEVVPAPVGVLADRNTDILRYVPSPSALLRACAAINELLGEPVRALLAASHLRRH
jgi:hypothetical protein